MNYEQIRQRLNALDALNEIFYEIQSLHVQMHERRFGQKEQLESDAVSVDQLVQKLSAMTARMERELFPPETPIAVIKSTEEAVQPTPPTETTPLAKIRKPRREKEAAEAATPSEESGKTEKPTKPSAVKIKKFGLVPQLVSAFKAAMAANEPLNTLEEALARAYGPSYSERVVSHLAGPGKQVNEPLPEASQPGHYLWKRARDATQTMAIHHYRADFGTKVTGELLGLYNELKLDKEERWDKFISIVKSWGIELEN